MRLRDDIPPTRLYSLYSSTTSTQNYLRGIKVSDANCKVTFTAIFPGCYTARMPHIHVEVYPSLAAATSYANKIKTTKFALVRKVCSKVYSKVSGYHASRAALNGITIATDNVFSDLSSLHLSAQTISLSGDTTNGYTGTITLGITI